MSLKMDISEQGLMMFFKPYQIDALKALWEQNEQSSREIWSAVGEDRISRASIINFLEGAVENGLLDKYEITGKGGLRGIYKHKYNLSEFKQQLAKTLIEKLLTEYPETTKQAIKNL